MKTVDTLVIGAGQAGLAAGYWLRRSRLEFLLVDGATRIGDSWRGRWDSLTLFTPAAYSALPGLTIPGDPHHFPTKDEVADYLETYARHFELPVTLGDRVARLERAGDHFVATLASGSPVAAGAVVVASGAFQVPAVPDVARGLGTAVVQLTPNTYRNPTTLRAGTVLIVGDGASGRQIAAELAATHRVVLATGRPRRVSADRVFGRSIFWWLDRSGLLRAHRNSMAGRMLREQDPFPGRHLALDKLRSAGVVTKRRVATLQGERAIFVDGSAEPIATVVWATGYRDDTDWIAIGGALDERGRVVESDGISPVEGLYFVGRNWQRNRGSALLLGVGEDARLVVDQVVLRAALPLAGPVAAMATA